MQHNFTTNLHRKKRLELFTKNVGDFIGQGRIGQKCIIWMYHKKFLRQLRSTTDVLIEKRQLKAQHQKQKKAVNFTKAINKNQNGIIVTDAL